MLEDRTTLNPSTIDVMGGIVPLKNKKPARYKLPSSGNLFLVRVVIYDKIERIQLAHYSDNNRSFEFEIGVEGRRMNYGPGRIW